jgi:aldose 1-epimerase
VDAVPDSSRLRLESACLRAEVAPQLGGSLLRLDWKGPDGLVPLLVPSAGDPDRPTERAMFVMLPWCNRIGGAGLVWQGRAYPMPALVEGQVLPIHGTGLHRPWQVIESAPARLRLSLRESGPPPFDFDAALDYALGDAGLTVRLAVTHRGPAPTPYGIGFHPWFSCGKGDRLSFRSGMYVEEDAERLPLRLVPTSAGSYDFLVPRTLPDRLINGTYLDWDGRAVLDREDGLRVRLRASSAVSRALHVFARKADAGFVCLEPVSHTVDCTNRPMRADAGLAVLTPGASLQGAIQISI